MQRVFASSYPVYNKYVKGDMLMNVDGTLTENTGAFATGYEKEAKDLRSSAYLLLHIYYIQPRHLSRS